MQIFIFCSNGFPYVFAPEFSTPAFSAPPNEYTYITNRSRVFTWELEHNFTHFTKCSRKRNNITHRPIYEKITEKLPKLNYTEIITATKCMA